MLSPRQTLPSSVTVDISDQEFSIRWADGHATTFPLDGLRKACPCANCQGHGAKKLPDPSIFDEAPRRRWEEVRAEKAGSVGVRITWDDGHDTGIYSWERLRRTCPCAECRKQHANP